MIHTMNYTPRYSVADDFNSWGEVAIFATQGALLLIGLYVVRAGVYQNVAADAAPFATVAAYCVAPWLYAVVSAKGKEAGNTIRLATATLWAAFVAIAILYLLFG